MSRVDIRKKLEKISFNNLDTFVLSYLAFFIAFIAVATYLHLPGPSSSYFNLGEVAIYIIAISFGKKAGGISAAFGSALMDILLAYSIWAPFTFIIKGAEAWIVGSIANNNGKN